MIDFYRSRLLKVLFYVSLGLLFQACSKEKSKKEEPKPSQSVSAPTSTVSSSANAVPVSQSVRPLEALAPLLTWVETLSNLEVIVGVTTTQMFTALSDQASPISYEISTAESTCNSTDLFEEIAIDSVSGELVIKAKEGALETCTLIISATNFPTTITKQVEISIQQALGFGSTPETFTSNEDSPMSELVIQAVSKLASPNYTWSLVADSSNCGDLAFFPSLAIDSQTGELSGTPSFDGTCSFTVEISDGTNFAQKPFNLIVSPVNDPLTYESGAVTRNVRNGTSFTETIRYSDEDDTPSYALELEASTCDEENWSVDLNIDSASGVLSGQPDFVGSCTISVSVVSGLETLAHDISFTSKRKNRSGPKR